MPRPVAALDRAVRAHWPALLLALLAALVAVWARHALFPAYSWNRDEPVYLWHVEILRAGQLTATDGGLPDLFHPWLSARGDGVLFSQYTLGWPLVLLAAQVLTGSAATALALGAGLAVLGTYAIGLELLRDRTIALAGAGLLVLSPLLAVQGGVYLSYLFTLGLGLLFGTALLIGVRERRRGLLVVAGLLVGWIFMTRPYDAILWAAAFVGCALVLHRDRWRSLVAPVATVAVASLPLVVATLAYNRHVTGGWLEFPITAADPLDSMGFGRKRLMPEYQPVLYGPTLALRSSLKNLALLPWFLVGAYGGAVLAVWGSWKGRRDHGTWGLLLVAAVFPIGYFVFWGTYLSSQAARVSGPIYLVPAYASTCLLMAVPLVEVWRRHRRQGAYLALALVAVTVPAAVSRLGLNAEISRHQAAWRASTAELDEPSLVFVADSGPYLGFLNPFSTNSPALDDEVLYATHGHPSMFELIDRSPDREVYLQRASEASEDLGPSEDPRAFEVELLPLEVLAADAMVLTVTPEVPAGSVGVVTVDAGAGAIARTVRPGQDVTLTIRSGPGAGDLALGPGGLLVVTLGLGSDEAQAVAAPVVRRSVPYRSVDAGIEVALPWLAERSLEVGDTLQWRDTPDLAELDARLSPR
jgi:4-amino-4-deoxy-L-arabinose transferase-like glycosyltransferase